MVSLTVTLRLLFVDAAGPAGRLARRRHLVGNVVGRTDSAVDLRRRHWLDRGLPHPETLFGQSNTAVGRTSTISGTDITNGRFSVDMTTVKSDQSLHDERFQGRIMDTSQYPTAAFALTSPIRLGSIPA
jgi:hypothetical protein